MCEHMTLLAQLDDFRWIQICEHNTIHFSWGPLILFLRADELKALCVALDKEVVARNEQRAQARRSNTFIPDQTTTLLWLNDCALRLATIDLLLLGTLVSQATRHLPFDCGVSDEVDIRLIRQSPEGAAHELAAPQLFSLN